MLMNPGSDEAVALNCCCPRLDNALGKGYMGMGNVFWINENCPLHSDSVGKKKEKAYETGTHKGEPHP